MNPTVTPDTATPTRGSFEELLGRMDPMTAHHIRAIQKLQEMLAPCKPALALKPVDQCLCGIAAQRDPFDQLWHCPACGGIWSDD